ncbi:hypothetical protein HOI26_05210 [Candidatus Woesearchaeota archaeon]|jgi:hypothetical protein|nr:hypothetical protein [Candidatus Woesearchaeota archaeon]MBT5740466.1 hypothetical protein [Candidatus Woesearchaeota archaeon]
MRKELLVFSLLFLLVLIVGCGKLQLEIEENNESVILNETIEIENDIVEIEVEQLNNTTSCISNSNCESGDLCINKVCGKIADNYITEDCDNTCKVTGATIITSDDETYEVSPGEGSFTFAGAVEWKLQSTPDYCQGETPKSPIKLIKKNTGKILSEEIIILNENETSSTITHPNIARVQFTLNLAVADETCS